MALSSFSQTSQKKQIKLQFPKYVNEFVYTKQSCKLKVFDNLKLDIKPQFIKIDVEGYELNVLKGAKKNIKYAKYILIEHQFSNQYQNNFSKIKKLLKQNNFKKIKSFYFPSLHYRDILFLNKRYNKNYY